MKTYIRRIVGTLLALGLLFCVIACDNIVLTEARKVDNSPIDGLQVVTIEGCEYFVVENGIRTVSDAYSFTMCHKGNCKNEIHKTPR